MTKVYCIVGLPGSGKTYLANTLKTGNTFVIDDIKTQEEMPENGVYDAVIITDPYFCLHATRFHAEKAITAKYDELEWIFFENDKEKCLKNVVHRNDGRKVERLINFLATGYEIPVGYEPVKIWQP